MAGIKENVWLMQNELRNKEGITGIDAMHHVLMVMLAKSFTIKQCQKLNIPEEYAFENMINLNKTDLYNKFYNPMNSQNCIVRYIRQGDMFGYSKDLPFQIKNESTLEYMYHKINGISTEELMNTYDIVGDIYEHFINREGSTMKDLGQYFTDRSLIKYIVELCNPQLNDGNVPTIWDPSSGTGGFIIEYIRQLNQNNDNINWSLNKNNLFANDINKNTYSLLKQNLYYSLKEGSGITIKLLDSLINNDDQMYDYILANPPFGVKGLKYKDMNKKIKSLGINGTKGEILFLQLCMCKLNDNGKCAIVVPEGVLFNSTKMYKETREYLIKNFNLKKVIKVGDGDFFKNTGVKTSVLFFEKSGKTEVIEFVQVNKIDSSIEEISLMDINIDKIIENDYSLNTNLYKENKINVNKEFELVDFKDICTDEKFTVSPSTIVNVNGEYKYFTSSKYYKLCENYTEEGEYIIKGTHGNIEETIHYVNGKFSCGNNLLKLKVKEGINAKYIYYYIKINSDIFSNIGSETVIKYTSFNELSKCKIVLPPIEIQNRIVQQIDNIYEIEINSSKQIIESLKDSIKTIMENVIYRKDLNDCLVGDICDINTGKSLKKEQKLEGDIPYYGSNGPISYHKIIQNDGEYIITGRVGTIGTYYYINGPFSICDNAFHIKNVSNNLTRYLYFNFKYNVTINGNDTVVSQINKTYFRNIRLNLPPTEIQRLILDKIEPKETLIQELEKNISRAKQEAKDIINILFV